MSGYTTIAQAAKDLLNKPRQRFLVPGILPIGVSILYGGSGAGKTGLAVNLSIAVASGSSFLEQRIEPGGVLYVAAEDYEGVKERLIAASFAADHEPEDLKIAIVERPEAALTTEAGRNIILSEAGKLAGNAENKVRLIVVDTLAASFGERSQDDASWANAFMNNLDILSRSMDCAVLVIHHTGKDRNAGMRGSQAFYDRSDSVIQVKAGAGSASKPTGRTPKIRNGSKGGLSFEYRIDGYPLPAFGGEVVSTQFVTDVTLKSAASDQAESTEKRTDADTLFEVQKTIAGPNGTASVKDLQDTFYALLSDRKPEAQRKAFNTNIRKLEAEGKITVSGNSVSVVVSEETAHNNAHKAGRVNCERGSVSAPPLRGERSHAHNTIQPDRIIAKVDQIERDIGLGRLSDQIRTQIESELRLQGANIDTITRSIRRQVIESGGQKRAS